MIQTRSGSSVTPLPDELVTEILSRMPAHDVWKCRSVCRRWRALISTQHFQEMHIKAKAHHSLMILVKKRCPKTNSQQRLLLDKWEQPRKRPTILRGRPNFIDNSRSPAFEFELSYDGLIVFKSVDYKKGSWPWGFNVMNPISGDVVRVDMPRSEFDLCGMFFNPFIKEYCILVRTWGAVVEFQMLNLGAQPCRRVLKPPVFSPPNPRNLPVVIEDDATIYWLTRHSSECFPFPFSEILITAFDIKTEVFSLLPHPDNIEYDDRHLFHSSIYIIKKDGLLSFVQSKITLDKSSLIINMWTLKDTAARLWIKTHSFSIDVDRFRNLGLTCLTGFKVMAVEKGEWLLEYFGEGVYAYSLELETLRKIGTYKNSLLSIYVPSLVSLKNCKPRICI